MLTVNSNDRVRSTTAVVDKHQLPVSWRVLLQAQVANSCRKNRLNTGVAVVKWFWSGTFGKSTHLEQPYFEVTQIVGSKTCRYANTTFECAKIALGTVGES